MGLAATALTFDGALRAAAARLARAGVPEPRADAEVLLAHVLGIARAGLVASARRPLVGEDLERFEGLVARRAAREPVFYLVGEREFWSLPIAVDRRVLIPRPETELLVETARRVAPAARRVLDAGTGSGAVAAALARELPQARVWASDREAGALEVAQGNLARHAPAVGLVRADWVAPFRRGAFDLIVSNPPYVAEAELAALAPEVCEHEPRAALAAGPDGLGALRVLVAQAADVLVPGGWLVMEVGAGQAEAVRAGVAADGCWARPIVRRDPAGIERVLAAERRRGWTSS